MSFRTCSYRGCGHRCINGRPNGKFVLFKFPKDPKRHEKWLKFGGVSKQSIQKAMFMCSIHFDKRYISVNSRRTCLVGDSTPNPYSEKLLCDEKNNEEAFEEIFVKCSKENSTQAEGQIQCLTSKQDEESLEDINCSMQEKVDNIIIDEQCAAIGEREQQYNIKEYATFGEYVACTVSDAEEDLSPSNAADAHSSDENKIIYESTLGEPSPLHNDLQFDEAEVTCYNIPIKRHTNDTDGESLNAVDVRTLILHGKEYVQMPKAYYIREKKQLLKTIQKYEQLFQSVQKRINSFNNLK